jgi:hypothetical protein
MMGLTIIGSSVIGRSNKPHILCAFCASAGGALKGKGVGTKGLWPSIDNAGE